RLDVAVQHLATVGVGQGTGRLKTQAGHSFPAIRDVGEEGQIVGGFGKGDDVRARRLGERFADITKDDAEVEAVDQGHGEEGDSLVETGVQTRDDVGVLAQFRND